MVPQVSGNEAIAKGYGGKCVAYRSAIAIVQRDDLSKDDKVKRLEMHLQQADKDRKHFLDKDKEKDGD